MDDFATERSEINNISNELIEQLNILNSELKRSIILHRNGINLLRNGKDHNLDINTELVCQKKTKIQNKLKI